MILQWCVFLVMLFSSILYALLLRRVVKIQEITIEYLETELDKLIPGSHCGLCGRFVKGDPGDKSYPLDWRWTMCPECRALGEMSEEDFLLLVSSGAIKSGISRRLEVEHLLRRHDQKR